MEGTEKPEKAELPEKSGEAGKPETAKPAARGRILWLDGLKGLCALFIFTHHFLLGFYPATYFYTDAQSKSSWDRFVAISPLGILNNGNFWLCIFFLTTGFVMAKGVFGLKPESFRDGLGKMLLRRYPRLLVPVFVTGVLNYLLIHLMNATGLNYIHKTTELSPLGLLLHSLVLQWITPDSLVLGPFWMLHLLLFGSFLAILLAVPDKKEYWWYPFLLLFLAYPLGCIDRYYSGFCFGVFLADCYCLRRDWFAGLGKRLTEGPLKQSGPWLLGLLLIFLGLFLGGYPSYVELPENIYRIFRFYVVRVYNAYEVIHCVGALIFLSGLFILPKKRLLESRVFQFLGSLTFPIYLVHIMWIEYLGYFLGDAFRPMLGQDLSSLVTYCILLAGILASALVYRRLKLV